MKNKVIVRLLAGIIVILLSFIVILFLVPVLAVGAVIWLGLLAILSRRFAALLIIVIGLILLIIGIVALIR